MRDRACEAARARRCLHSPKAKVTESRVTRSSWRMRDHAGHAGRHCIPPPPRALAYLREGHALMASRSPRGHRFHLFRPLRFARCRRLGDHLARRAHQPWQLAAGPGRAVKGTATVFSTWFAMRHGLPALGACEMQQMHAGDELADAGKRSGSVKADRIAGRGNEQ